MTGRDGLGRVTVQQQVPNAAKPLPLNETLQDSWVYDPPSAKGAIASVTRRRGYGAPAANAIVWAESYGYESLTARPSTISTNVAEPGVVLSSAMSYDGYGRPSMHTYPSGLIVQTQYAAYGHPGAMANYSTQFIYWEATAHDAWNKPTTDRYLDGTTGTYVNYQSTGQARTMSWLRNSATEDALTYSYDSFGNLVTQQRQAASASNTETYSYDKLQRLGSAARSIGAGVNYTYAANGNILTKTDNGVSTYTTARSEERQAVVRTRS